MKGTFPEKHEGEKGMGSTSPTAIQFLWIRMTRRSAETCRNMQKCAEMCT